MQVRMKQERANQMGWTIPTFPATTFVFVFPVFIRSWNKHQRIDSSCAPDMSGAVIILGQLPMPCDVEWKHTVPVNRYQRR